MSIMESTPADVTVVSPNRPSDDQLDLFGITHRGKVRTNNEDHFLICTVHPQVVVHGTSLPNADALPLRGTRLATLMVVADGVGGAAAGSEAARLATEAITRYVSSTLRSYHAAGSAPDAEILAALRAAALEAHDAVLAESSTRDDKRKMATTLTVAIAVWPWLYVTQVGDSRLYYHANGVLRQITRDQTVGQELVDQGVLPADKLHRSPLRNVLSRAIGSDEALPEVTLVDVSERSCTLVLCSDGLTKHVSDDDIAAALATPRSSEQVARELLDLALSRGGTDNITIVIASAPLKRASNLEQSCG